MSMEKFEDVIEQMMQDRGMPAINERVNISIADAHSVLQRAALWYFDRIGRQFIITPEYESVADWLSNNYGRGLLLYGNHGRGKTALAKYIIPAILLYYNSPRLVCHVYNATKLGDKLAEALTKKLVIVDDIGVEGVSVHYGNRKNPMDELMDAVEQDGKLVILTTNLTGEELVQKYGAGVYDRIIATTRRIAFSGSSFRA